MSLQQSDPVSCVDNDVLDYIGGLQGDNLSCVGEGEDEGAYVVLQ